MLPTTRNIFRMASLSLAGLLAACGGGGGSGTQAPGTLGVAMTDAPACGYDAVNVTVNKVRVHQSATAGDQDAGWTDITLNPARKINLLDLTNGVLEPLGETPLAAGHYTQVRLVLDANTGSGMANSIVLTTSPPNTNEISLATPSAVQSGIKLVHGFDVAAGQRVDLVLDFDACKSIVKRGNSGGYGLKPVVNVIPTVLNGIDGFIDPALSSSHVQVSAQQDGSVVRSTVPNDKGEFFLARLAPGNYDVVITANGHASAVIATVPVASSTSIVNLSTAAAPIALAPSATGTIRGTLTLPASFSDAAYVAAQQSFASGPKVTIKYQGVDVTADGGYALSNLPTAAPQLGLYSASLPIQLASQTNTVPGTGKYAVQASAAGFASQTQTVDITAADQTGIDFVFP